MKISFQRSNSPAFVTGKVIFKGALRGFFTGCIESLEENQHFLRVDAFVSREKKHGMN